MILKEDNYFLSGILIYQDSDNNGNPVDDIDYTESIITLPTTESGLISGD